MNWKRWIFILMLLLLPFLATGCWNRHVLDKVGLVTAVGIDRGEDQQIEFTVQLINPATIKHTSDSGSGQKNPSIILRSNGSTVFEAVRNLTEKSGRRLNYSHNMVIVLGSKLAREGVLSVLDFFIRDHEMRFKTWVVVTEGKAADIIQADPSMENISAKNLKLLLKDYGIVSHSVAVNLLELINELMDESLQAVVGRVELENPQEKKGLILSGAGVFSQDKLIDWLDPINTRGYLWIREKVKSGILVIPCPKEEDKFISLEIKKAKSSIKPYLDEGKMKYLIEISVKSALGEQMCNEDLTNPEMIKVLEEEQQKKVAKEVEMSLEGAQKNLKLDIIGLGEATMRKYPKEWKEMKEQWESEFPNVEVEVQVNSKITSTGLSNRIKINK